MCNPAKIIDSPTAEISKDKDALLRLILPIAVAIVQVSGAKGEEWIECSSLGRNDAIAWVGASGIACGNAGLELKGRKGIDINVCSAVIPGSAEGTDAATA